MTTWPLGTLLSGPVAILSCPGLTQLIEGSFITRGLLRLGRCFICFHLLACLLGVFELDLVLLLLSLVLSRLPLLRPEMELTLFEVIISLFSITLRWNRNLLWRNSRRIWKNYKHLPLHCAHRLCIKASFS